MVANASAFAPNVQRGLQAAEKIISLLERVPKIQDPMYISKREEVILIVSASCEIRD